MLVAQVDLRVPAGVQPGQKLVMKGKGVPKLGNENQRGDHIVTVNVSIPEKLSDRERELVEELASFRSSPSGNGDQQSRAKGGKGSRSFF